MGLLSKIFPSENERELKKLRKIADQVVERIKHYETIPPQELPTVTQTLKKRLQSGETLDDILPDAFAAICVAAYYVIQQKPYYVQILGGIALHQGRICQMATGEGKTLVSIMPAYLNALAGKGVHIVTVNDYLASFHCEWMGKIHRFMGLTVGVISPKLSNENKRRAYSCDITYGTNSEFGFDYLRDNMAMSKKELVQRGLEFAIVDEVDSILIDEARTPLIISGQGKQSSDGYKKADKFVKALITKGKTFVSDSEKKPKDEKSTDYYEYDEKNKTVNLTDLGVKEAEAFYDIENLGDIENTDVNHFIRQALLANVCKQKDTDYIVKNQEILIVDEFTGRVLEGRRYSEGLHQAIEAKENCPIKEESQTYATISYQNLFRLYNKLSGMTGTAKTEESEFNSIYNLDVVVIPTNRPCIREDKPDVVFNTHAGKIKAIVNDIIECHEKGRPVLVGTVSIARSEELSNELKKKGLKHNVLNAKEHEKEAEIIAQAGRLGSITIATNMAGRGTDILLGGNPEYAAKEKMIAEGYELEQVEMASSFIEGDEDIARLQAHYRELLRECKEKLIDDKQRVIEAGGLHVIGTERHESRRIDDQLRGRAGRQGDPGSSIFYISLDDDLIRLFGAEKVQLAKNVYGSLSENDDTPISLGLISKAIENAQKAIETNNFGARKRVLQYDDVFNMQRNLIYSERRKVIDGENISADIKDMLKLYCDYNFDKVMEDVEKLSDADIDKLNGKASLFFPGGGSFFTELDKTRKKDELKQDWDTTISDFYEEIRTRYKELDLNPDEIERMFLLRTITSLWMEHIDAMDNLKNNVRLQAYAQRDPLIEYKIQGYDMFEELQQNIKLTTIRYLFFTEVRKNLNADVENKVIPAQSTNGKLDFDAQCPCGSGKRYKDCCGKEKHEQYKEEQRKLHREESKLKKKQNEEKTKANKKNKK